MRNKENSKNTLSCFIPDLENSVHQAPRLAGYLLYYYYNVIIIIIVALVVIAS